MKLSERMLDTIYWLYWDNRQVASSRTIAALEHRGLVWTRYTDGKHCLTAKGVEIAKKLDTGEMGTP